MDAITIASIIEHQQLTILFQPIWDHAKQQILAYEALSRGPSHSAYHQATDLFSRAAELGYRYPLEWLCAQLAVERANHLALAGKLFLNFSAESLFQQLQTSYETLKVWQQQHQHGLVIELTEQTPCELGTQERELLFKLRRLGIEIALDDFGSGYAGLQELLELQPDYIKLDGYFADTFQSSPHTNSAIEMMVGLAEHLNATLIAEKIERAEQLELMMGLNIHLFQGFFIQRPAIHASPLTHLYSVSQTVNEEPYTARSLLHALPSIEPELPSHELLARMRDDKSLSFAVVTDPQGKVLGVIRREELLEWHSGPFGHSLNQHTTVAKLMDDEPITVESFLPLSEVGRRLSHSDATRLDSAFVITRQGIYQGIGFALELMRRLSSYKLELARYANPLTLLPGNVPLHRTLKQLMSSQESFEIGYFDLNNFKPFNDCCGYERGDQMIRLVAQLLVQYLKPYTRFIGHLGGDDFIVIFQKLATWSPPVKKLQQTFFERSQRLYRKEDLDNGGIMSEDRAGNRQFFPLTQLACGVTCWSSQQEPSLEKLSELASYAKKQAKMASNNFFYMKVQHTETIF